MRERALVFLTVAAAACSSGRRADPITRENELAGDPAWRIDRWQDGQVEGYGDAISLHPGDTLHVAVSSAPVPVTWSVFRVGWYQGAGARKIADGGTFDGAPQPGCPMDPVTARVECAWKTSLSVPVASDALSGVYFVKLETQGGGSYVPYVVVDGRAADLVVNVNVTSWQAYNDYRGESLYADASGRMPSGKAWEVSFDRPFHNGFGFGRFLEWEVYFVAFVEALGYDVTYTTAFDIAADPGSLRRARAFVSLANDEYWLPAQRQAVDAARDAGVNLAFLGADQSLWRIRPQPSSSGRPDRVIACYKTDQARDPVLAADGPSAATARFRDEPNPAPENALIGVMYEGWLSLSQPLVVRTPDHWAFAGTGLAAGDVLPGIVSGEFDQRYDNGVEPAGLVELANAGIVSGQGWPDRTSMTTYVAASGAQVIAVGTIGWSRGLGATPYASPAVARITRNVLDRFTSSAGLPDPDGAPWTRPGSQPVVDGRWATTVSTVVSGIHTPGGVAVAADGTIFVSDTWGHSVKRIVPGGAPELYAGAGIGGYRDGPGAAAFFSFPLGLTVARDGTVYVADSYNNVIRAIAPDAAHTVSNYAGINSVIGGRADGPGARARFSRPVSVALAPDGSLVVADMQNDRVASIAPDAAHTVRTLADTGTPSAVTVGADGAVYVVGTYQHTLKKIAGGKVQLLAGGSDGGQMADGPTSHALIDAQGGIALAGGVVYFSDTANLRIRALDLAHAILYTVAGSGRPAMDDGGADGAGFLCPLALALAPDGSLIVTDSGNGALRRIQF